MCRLVLSFIILAFSTALAAQVDGRVVAVQQAQIQKIDRDLEQLASRNQFNGVLQQIQAQATCTAIRPGIGWVFAVTRTNGAQTCDQLCSQQTEGQAGRLSCFNSLHIYAINNAAPKDQAIGFKTYRYNTCAYLDFGPNYCCCGN